MHTHNRQSAHTQQTESGVGLVLMWSGVGLVLTDSLVAAGSRLDSGKWGCDLDLCWFCLIPCLQIVLWWILGQVRAGLVAEPPGFV